MFLRKTTTIFHLLYKEAHTLFHKSFAFVSDFDGTLTKKDFYKIIIDDYLGDKGQTLYQEWREGLYEDQAFLETIYRSINLEESKILEDIVNLKWDESAPYFIQQVEKKGGTFIILSGGTNYYIDSFLKAKGLSHIQVYAHSGIYKNKGIHLQIDKQNPYYSEKYGMDKAKVLIDLKKQYTKVYYAGDSATDLPACQVADLAFAKGKLPDLLATKNIPFIPFDSFQDILLVLIQKGLLS